MSLEIRAEPVPLKVDPYGVVRVGGTRVTLDTIVYAFRQGTPPTRSRVNMTPSSGPTSTRRSRTTCATRRRWTPI